MICSWHHPMTNSGWPNSTAWPFWLWPQLRCLTFAALTLAGAETGKVLANDLLMASPDDKQRLAELDSLAVLVMAAAALLNVRCAYVSRRRNGQSSGKGVT